MIMFVKISSVLVLGLALPLLLLTNCTKNHLPEPPICYQSDIEPIIISNCTQSGCHNGTDQVAGYNFSSYAGILKGVTPGDYRGSELYKVLLIPFGEKRMPQSPYDLLSDQEIGLIARWIEEGAINSVNCQSACDTTNVGFALTIKPIITTYCTGCHSGSQPQGDINLDSWAKVKPFVDNGSFLGSIKHNSPYSAMPKDGSMLPDCQIKLIEKWVADGAQNN